MKQNIPKKFFILGSHPDSLIIFRLHLMKEFLAMGWEVTALAPYDQNVATELSNSGIKFKSVNLERNGINFIKDLFFILNLWFFLQKEKPDIMYNYTIKPVIYGGIASKFAGIANSYALITGAGYVFSNLSFKNKLIGRIGRALLKFSLKFNKKIYFQNKDNLKTFLDSKIIKPTQPVAIINGSGVDVHYFDIAPIPKNLTFLMISRFLIDKGVREYAEAARIIKTRYPFVTFKLAGWIDTNPNAITIDELNEWVSSGVVENLGKLNDVRGALASASVYVLPSYGEGTPRTVLEAMAMGRPIITTDVPGCRETVSDKKNGLLIPVHSSHALCEAMEYFIKNPIDIEQMGQMSRQIALEKYDVHKVNKTILNEMDFDPVSI